MSHPAAGLLERINGAEIEAWDAHVEFETLHPYLDGNGRGGRLLWAWHMMRTTNYRLERKFLHQFYYQSLNASRTSPRSPT